MIRACANIAVDDVKRSSAWYQCLLGCSSPMSPTSAHRELFDVLHDANADPILILSRWDHNPLAPLRGKEQGRTGHGVALFFRVLDFAESWKRARELGARVIAEPHPSRGFEILQYTIVDPDGYFVTVSAA